MSCDDQPGRRLSLTLEFDDGVGYGVQCRLPHSKPHIEVEGVNLTILEVSRVRRTPLLVIRMRARIQPRFFACLRSLEGEDEGGSGAKKQPRLPSHSPVSSGTTVSSFSPS